MSKYIILTTDEFNGKQKGVNIFYAAPILSGEHKGKFATSENALKEFPEIFEDLKYEVAELDNSVFVEDEAEKLRREKQIIEDRLKELEENG
jgi:2C-methyl-D-erythritol 2,4-cyclodiphosphate synthase